jgi:hypothetical protein
VISGFILSILLLWAGHGLAQEAPGDGVYGRFNGDLNLSAGLGAGLVIPTDDRYTIELRARYLDSAGVVIAPEWTPSEHSGAVGVALELRPLFLARFLSNTYTGLPWVDLTLDSFGIEVGSWLGPFNGGFGAALLIGTGIELPLGSRTNRGFWLRIAGRYLYASQNDRAAPAGGRSEVWIMGALLFKTAVDIGLAGWEPARYTL